MASAGCTEYSDAESEVLGRGSATARGLGRLAASVVLGCASCGHKAWGFSGKLRAWFGYKDCGECPHDCHACKFNCSTSLFHFFLRDCAYRPSNCYAQGGYADGTVNPPYSKSVFPVGHMVGGLPTGMPGGCGTPGGCGR